MARLLGIDAEKNVVRAVLIRTAYRKVILEGFGEVSVADAGSQIAAMKAAAGMVRPDAASVALSGEQSFYRRLDMPAAAQKELESVLAFELEATIPFEMDDAIFDYRVLKREPGSTTIPVFAAVARTADVRERITAVREAIDLEPERVSTGPLSLANLETVMPTLSKPPGVATGPVVLLNLESHTSDMLVVSDGEPVFARTLSRGMAGLTFESAPLFARELRQTLAAWRNLGGNPPAGIYLIGGGTSLHSAEQWFSGELGLPLLPLPQARLEGITPEQTAVLPRFAKALALALGLAGRPRGLNLRRGALEAERSYPFLREKVPMLAGLGTVIALSFGFSIIAEMRGLNAEHEALTGVLSSASRDVLGEETSDPIRARELLESGPAADEDPMPRVDAFDVMVQLSKAVPKEVTHDVLELDVNRGHATIQGVVPSVADAQAITEKLKEYKCFRDVKVGRFSQFTEGKQKYVLEMTLACEDKNKKKPKSSAEGEGTSSPAEKPEGI
ncbi:type IV pilus biogenesis protein PilM [Chondromyces crocatus]|uniref:General secretion pathway protein GspL n=1 Tax=Chondromyces crocatus TaxID=52 RepID=A0A0K1E780_CHOCO|nr:pilus assembly protein PilM [Chondromyces crocatus]AKT36709.1 general secretion pathway protein GspL [Chondromyces crocatus]